MLYSDTRTDLTEILLVGGNWAPILAIHLGKLNEWLGTLGIVMAILASLFAIIDHALKIWWKMKKDRKE